MIHQRFISFRKSPFHKLNATKCTQRNKTTEDKSLPPTTSQFNFIFAFLIEQNYESSPGGQKKTGTVFRCVCKNEIHLSFCDHEMEGNVL